jgi:glycosyltransferase involved in cell wall biosynthesis
MEQPSQLLTTSAGPRRYRFGFVLSTALGNITRYNNLRKFAERDREVDFVWARVDHVVAPGRADPFRWLPVPLRMRAIVLWQAAPVLRRLGTFDAVMIHLFEVDILTALRARFYRRPVRIVSTDDAPAVDPQTYPFHPVDRRKPAWKRRLRLEIDLWRARRADLLLPFSKWAGEMLVSGAGVPAHRVRPLHVGLDLDTWRAVAKPERAPGERIRLLFVGGEFERKGGPLLLQVFASHLAELAELHLVTKSAPADLPAHVFVHDALGSNDPLLLELYRQADLFVLPTTSDLMPWVVLEAMASACPVITTPVGAIPEMIQDGVTGLLVPVGRADLLVGAILSLIANPALRRAMGARGREFVEAHYDAAANVPAILQAMKRCVDQRALASS